LIKFTDTHLASTFGSDVDLISTTNRFDFQAVHVEQVSSVADVPPRHPSVGLVPPHADIHDVQQLAVSRGGGRGRLRKFPLRMEEVRRRRRHRTLPLIERFCAS
jgi:hypothetical protein